MGREKGKLCLELITWIFLTCLLPISIFLFGVYTSILWTEARISDYQIDCLALENGITQTFIQRNLVKNQPFCQDPNLIMDHSVVSTKNQIHSFGIIWSEKSPTNVKIHQCQQGRQVIDVRTNTGYFGFQDINFCLLVDDAVSTLFSTKADFENVKLEFPSDYSLDVISEKGKILFSSHPRKGGVFFAILDEWIFQVLSFAPVILNLIFLTIIGDYFVMKSKYGILPYSVFYFNFLCILALNFLFMKQSGYASSFHITLFIIHCVFGLFILTSGNAVFHMTFGTMRNQSVYFSNTSQKNIVCALTYFLYFVFLPYLSSFLIHYILLIATYNLAPVIILNSSLIIKIISVVKKKGRTYSLWFHVLGSLTLTLILNYVFCFTNRHSAIMAWVYFCIIYAVQGILMAFLYCQMRIGAWFFLPMKYRVECPKYLKKISEIYSFKAIANNEIDCCGLCTNLLTEPPLEFLDNEIRNNKFYKLLRKEEDVFVHLKCFHKYHLECIFPQMIKEGGECPLCLDERRGTSYHIERVGPNDSWNPDY